MADLQVSLAGPADAAALHALRHEVFVVGQGVPPELERDSADATAVHVVARRGTEMVATGRLVERGDVAAVGRMAVAAPERGSGAGRAVLRALEHVAVRSGLARVELHAQTHARGFYARCGYAEVGGEYEEAGIAHVTMQRLLPELREVADADAEAVQSLIGGCWAEYPGCVMDVDGEEPWMRAPATAYAAQGGRMWVLADRSRPGLLLACCGAKPLGGDRVELKNMYVAAGARRFGYARLLEALVVAQARAWDASVLELWSDTRFLDAHATYSALGWRRGDGSRDLHDLSGTTEIPFSRAL